MNLAQYFEDVKVREELARALSRSPDYLYQIATNRRQASPALAIAIEKATGGKVSRAELRSDIFGDEPKRKKAA
jgi:DNA-binding transcriptional regulator YdaS (Cro superfamily)